MRKDNLRRVKSKAKPQPKVQHVAPDAAPVSGNPAPFIMPIAAGHADTEIAFTDGQGSIVLRMRLKQVEMVSNGPSTAIFQTLDAFTGSGICTTCKGDGYLVQLGTTVHSTVQCGDCQGTGATF